MSAPGDAPEHGVQVASDRSFIFEERGESASLDVEVYRDGRRVPDPEVRFTSSDPSVISVDRDGVLVAEAGHGSAVITIEADGVPPVVANAVVAELTPRARRLDSHQILHVDNDLAHATIQVDGDGAAFAVGDILISGERDGLFARVTEVWPQDDGTYTIAYDTDVAATEAFENLDLRAHTDPLVFDPGQHAELVDSLTCVAEQHARIELSGPEIAPLIDTKLHFDYEIRSRRVTRAELYLTGNLGVDVRTGEVRIDGTFGGEFRCTVPLPDISLPTVPVLGPVLGVGGTLSSRVGVQGGAFFEMAELAYIGPTLAKEMEAKLGLRVSGDEGVETIQGVEIVRDDVTHGEGMGELHDGELQLDIMPFLETTLTVRIGAGPIGVDIDLLDVTAGGGAELSLSPPFDPYEAGYRGPAWELFVAGSADLHPLLDLGALLDFLKDKLGLSVADEARYELEPQLWEGRYAVKTSPRPEVATDRDHIALGEEVEITATELGDYDGSVEYLLHRCGEGSADVLADVSAGKPAHFTPYAESDRGVHGLNVLLWDGRFGNLGLPYAARTPRELLVGDEPDRACE